MATNANTAGDERIGGYKVVRLILNGQSTCVLEVLQESTSKRFAIKQILPGKMDEPDERKSLLYEAKLGTDLRHPNLVRVHELVKDPEGWYFVMDFFPSQTLRLPLGKPKEYPMPRAQLHRIIEQAAQALAYMHDKGYVHRDVKPENILFNKSGEVRVIDYALALKIPTGLSKMFAGKPRRQGTHSYMSPEQIRCDPLSISADVYSFGTVCYELACGRQPFRANSQNDLLNKHLREQASPPTVYNKEITREYSDLVMSMIAKNPKDRPADLRDMLSRFAKVRIYQDDPPPTRPDAF